MEKISERVYYMKYDDETARPSLGLVIGDNSSLVVDSGNSKEHVEEFLRASETMGVDNLKYLGITHFHWDHIYGIPYMRLSSIGSEATQNKLRRLNRIADENLDCEKEEQNTLEHLKKLKNEIEFSGLDIGFQKKVRLDLGGVECVIEHIGGDHSEDSSLIYVETEKVMFLGDATYRGFRGRARYHTLKNVESIAEKILGYDCDFYLTSHKEIYSRTEMEKLLDTMIEIGRKAEEISSSEEAEALRRSLEEEERFFLDAFLSGI